MEIPPESNVIPVCVGGGGGEEAGVREGGGGAGVRGWGEVQGMISHGGEKGLGRRTYLFPPKLLVGCLVNSCTSAQVTMATLQIPLLHT